MHVTDVQERAPAPSAAGNGSTPASALLVYFVLGILFGIVLTKAEAISWFRIQEMFRFQSFHMFGIIGAAVVVAMLSLKLIRRSGMRALTGEPIVIPPKKLGTGRRYWIGGSLFGFGWALTGACPGPLFILLGNGIGVMSIVILSAIAGTWTYGWLRPRLPH